MEPTKFDKLIQQKLKGENILHQKEMNDSKSFIWASVVENKKQKNTATMIAIAAAIICVLLLPIYFHNTTKAEYANKIEDLEGIIQQVITKNTQQLNITREQEKELLCKEIDLLTKEVHSLKERQQLKVITLPTEPIIMKEIVYVKDTVYIKTEPNVQQVQLANKAPETELINPKESKDEVSQVIFPDYKSSTSATKRTQNSIKVIINPFNN